jgi:hypothetical protein
MRYDNFIHGVTTLQRYFSDPGGFHIDAEHDQFFVHATDKRLTDSDVERMKEWGWFQPDGPGDSYDPDEGWSCWI